ncbi:MAG: histidine kinase [Saprospiraceae bacterium]|nr:histidine kinase [Saprospiraceae bacterium]
MNRPIPVRQRWYMAAGLMLVFLPLGTYVTAYDRSWAVLSARGFPDFTVQFLVSTLVTFAWVSGADWLHRRLNYHFGARLEKWGPTGANILTALPIFLAGMAGIILILEANQWLFYQALNMAPGIADEARACRIIYGLFASLSLCVYMLIANHHIMEFTKEAQLKAEQLEKENLLSQFNALKSQVNPHFLFNSLSILASLVKKDPELSELFIDRLSRAYRYILEEHESAVAPLQKELDFLQAYTFLLRTRFEHKFEVHLQLSKTTIEQSSIPPLTLQMLVENAVKLNRMSEKEPLIITISEESDMLIVRNKYRPRGQEAHSTSLGLQNIINRYALLTDRPVWAGEREDEFWVKIPLLH